MPFGPNNILVVYNSADVASEELATSYCYSKSIPSSNLLSVTTDTDSTFESLTEYQTDLETPVINKINTLLSNNTKISAVVLSFRIPVLYTDSTTKSTSSRLSSCMMTNRSQGYPNPLYMNLDVDNTVSDEHAMLCVTHLDASTLLIARSRLNAISQSASSLKFNGYVYIDPNDRYEDTQESRQWVDSLSSTSIDSPFNTIVAPEELEGSNTYFSRIVDGGVVFSSGISTAGTGYFSNSRSSKAFYFNADLDGFASPRDSTSQKPAMKALEDNYIIVAGMVADPSTSDNTYQYPDPRSILYCVKNNVPLGMGIVWSQRMIGEHLAVYGDPLSTFFLEAPPDAKFSAIEGMFSSISYMAQARAHLRTRELYSSRIIRTIAASGDAELKIKFMADARAIAFAEDGMSVGILSDPASELRNMSKHAGYAIDDTLTMPAFEEIIKITNKKIPVSFLRSTTDSQLIINRIGSGLLQPKGIATVEFRIPTISGMPRFFHIQAVGVDDEGNIIFDVDSINRQDLWRYEEEPGIMKSIPAQGIYTALAGRYVEFTHPGASSPPLLRVHCTFNIIVIGDSPQEIHQMEWRTQE